MVLLGQSCCLPAEVVVFGKTGFFGSKWMYSGRCDCIWAKVILFGQNGCIREKVVFFGL